MHMLYCTIGYCVYNTFNTRGNKMTDSQIEQREAEWEAEYKKLYSAAEATGFDYINGIWYEDWASDMATLKVWGSYEAMEAAYDS